MSVRLTTAQAPVRWLVAQRSELDGTDVLLFAGVFGILRHGNVLGFGDTLQVDREDLSTSCGQIEQGMALATAAFAHMTRGYAHATDRRQVMVGRSAAEALDDVFGGKHGNGSVFTWAVLPAETRDIRCSRESHNRHLR